MKSFAREFKSRSRPNTRRSTELGGSREVSPSKESCRDSVRFDADDGGSVVATALSHLADFLTKVEYF